MAAVINVLFSIIFKQCSYEGCTFKAGRKVLKLHWIQVKQKKINKKQKKLNINVIFEFHSEKNMKFVL